MKKIFLLLSFIGYINFFSCKLPKNTKASYEFLREETAINKIEIVIINDFGEHNEESYKIGPILKVVLEIQEKDVFLDDFNLLRCYLRGYPHAAQGVSIGETAIKILYNTGEYEIIGVNGEGYYIYGGNNIDGGWGYHNFGFYYFDETEFNVLIEKYTQSATIK